jgi:hypothetical protein
MIASSSCGLSQQVHLLYGGQLVLALAVDLRQPTQKVLVVLPFYPLVRVDSPEILGCVRSGPGRARLAAYHVQSADAVACRVDSVVEVAGERSFSGGTSISLHSLSLWLATVKPSAAGLGR